MSGLSAASIFAWHVGIWIHRPKQTESVEPATRPPENPKYIFLTHLRKKEKR